MRVESRRFLWMCMTDKTAAEYKVVVGVKCDASGHCIPTIKTTWDTIARIFGLDGPDDYTRCASGTNYVEIRREVSGRRFYVDCWYKP